MHLIIWDIGIDASRRGPCKTAIKVNLSVSRRVQGGAVCFSHCGATDQGACSSPGRCCKAEAACSWPISLIAKPKVLTCSYVSVCVGQAEHKWLPHSPVTLENPLLGLLYVSVFA